jgi:hypothetical protein
MFSEMLLRLARRHLVMRENFVFALQILTTSLREASWVFLGRAEIVIMRNPAEPHIDFSSYSGLAQ